MSRTRLVLAALGISVLAATGLAGATGTAHAATARPTCPTDADNDCWRPNFQIWKTDGTLDIWSVPKGWEFAATDGESGGNGSWVEIDCQALGAPVDGLGQTVWDHLDNGGWVYDYYVDTYGDGYTLGVPGNPPAYPNCP